MGTRLYYPDVNRTFTMLVARAGLTAFMAGVARSVATANVTINFMQPGAFATDRLTCLVLEDVSLSVIDTL